MSKTRLPNLIERSGLTKVSFSFPYLIFMGEFVTLVNASGSHDHAASRIRQGQSSSVTGSVCYKVNHSSTSTNSISGIPLKQNKTVLAMCCSSRIRLISYNFIQCVKAMNCKYAHIMFWRVRMRTFPHFAVFGSVCVHP